MIHDQDVLRAISEHVQLFGYPPSQREIAAIKGLASSASGARLVRRLIAEGMIQVAPGRARGLSITRAGMKALTEEV